MAGNWHPSEKNFSNGIVILVLRSIWLERNARLFQNKAKSIVLIVDTIKEEVQEWIKAGILRE